MNEVLLVLVRALCLLLVVGWPNVGVGTRLVDGASIRRIACTSTINIGAAFPVTLDYVISDCVAPLSLLVSSTSNMNLTVARVAFSSITLAGNTALKLTIDGCSANVRISQHFLSITGSERRLELSVTRSSIRTTSGYLLYSGPSTQASAYCDACVQHWVDCNVTLQDFQVLYISKLWNSSLVLANSTFVSNYTAVAAGMNSIHIASSSGSTFSVQNVSYVVSLTFRSPTFVSTSVVWAFLPSWTGGSFTMSSNSQVNLTVVSISVRDYVYHKVSLSAVKGSFTRANVVLSSSRIAQSVETRNVSVSSYCEAQCIVVDASSFYDGSRINMTWIVFESVALRRAQLQSSSFLRSTTLSDNTTASLRHNTWMISELEANVLAATSNYFASPSVAAGAHFLAEQNVASSFTGSSLTVSFLAGTFWRGSKALIAGNAFRQLQGKLQFMHFTAVCEPRLLIAYNFYGTNSTLNPTLGIDCSGLSTADVVVCGNAVYHTRTSSSVTITIVASLLLNRNSSVERNTANYAAPSLDVTVFLVSSVSLASGAQLRHNVVRLNGVPTATYHPFGLSAASSGGGGEVIVVSGNVVHAYDGSGPREGDVVETAWCTPDADVCNNTCVVTNAGSFTVSLLHETFRSEEGSLKVADNIVRANRVPTLAYFTTFKSSVRKDSFRFHIVNNTFSSNNSKTVAIDVASLKVASGANVTVRENTLLAGGHIDDNRSSVNDGSECGRERDRQVVCGNVALVWGSLSLTYTVVKYAAIADGGAMSVALNAARVSNSSAASVFYCLVDEARSTGGRLLVASNVFVAWKIKLADCIVVKRVIVADEGQAMVVDNFVRASDCETVRASVMRTYEVRNNVTVTLNRIAAAPTEEDFEQAPPRLLEPCPEASSVLSVVCNNSIVTLATRLSVKVSMLLWRDTSFCQANQLTLSLNEINLTGVRNAEVALAEQLDAPSNVLCVHNIVYCSNVSSQLMMSVAGVRMIQSSTVVVFGNVAAVSNRTQVSQVASGVDCLSFSASSKKAFSTVVCNNTFFAEHVTMSLVFSWISLSFAPYYSTLGATLVMTNNNLLIDRVPNVALSAIRSVTTVGAVNISFNRAIIAGAITLSVTLCFGLRAYTNAAILSNVIAVHPFVDIQSSEFFRRSNTLVCPSSDDTAAPFLICGNTVDVEETSALRSVSVALLSSYDFSRNHLFLSLAGNNISITGSSSQLVVSFYGAMFISMAAGQGPLSVTFTQNTVALDCSRSTLWLLSSIVGTSSGCFVNVSNNHISTLSTGVSGSTTVHVFSDLTLQRLSSAPAVMKIAVSENSCSAVMSAVSSLSSFSVCSRCTTTFVGQELLFTKNIITQSAVLSEVLSSQAFVALLTGSSLTWTITGNLFLGTNVSLWSFVGVSSSATSTALAFNYSYSFTNNTLSATQTTNVSITVVPAATASDVSVLSQTALTVSANSMTSLSLTNCSVALVSARVHLLRVNATWEISANKLSFRDTASVTVVGLGLQNFGSMSLLRIIGNVIDTTSAGVRFVHLLSAAAISNTSIAMHRNSISLFDSSSSSGPANIRLFYVAGSCVGCVFNISNNTVFGEMNMTQNASSAVFEIAAVAVAKWATTPLSGLPILVSAAAAARQLHIANTSLLCGTCTTCSAVLVSLGPGSEMDGVSAVSCVVAVGGGALSAVLVGINASGAAVRRLELWGVNLTVDAGVLRSTVHGVAAGRRPTAVVAERCVVAVSSRESSGALCAVEYALGDADRVLVVNNTNSAPTAQLEDSADSDGGPNGTQHTFVAVANNVVMGQPGASPARLFALFRAAEVTVNTSVVVANNRFTSAAGLLHVRVVRNAFWPVLPSYAVVLTDNVAPSSFMIVDGAVGLAAVLTINVSGCAIGTLRVTAAAGNSSAGDCGVGACRVSVAVVNATVSRVVVVGVPGVNDVDALMQDAVCALDPLDAYSDDGDGAGCLSLVGTADIRNLSVAAERVALGSSSHDDSPMQRLRSAPAALLRVAGSDAVQRVAVAVRDVVGDVRRVLLNVTAVGRVAAVEVVVNDSVLRAAPAGLLALSRTRSVSSVDVRVHRSDVLNVNASVVSLDVGASTVQVVIVFAVCRLSGHAAAVTGAAAVQVAGRGAAVRRNDSSIVFDTVAVNGYDAVLALPAARDASTVSGGLSSTRSVTRSWTVAEHAASEDVSVLLESACTWWNHTLPWFPDGALRGLSAIRDYAVLCRSRLTGRACRCHLTSQTRSLSVLLPPTPTASGSSNTTRSASVVATPSQSSTRQRRTVSPEVTPWTLTRSESSAPGSVSRTASPLGTVSATESVSQLSPTVPPSASTSGSASLSRWTPAATSTVSRDRRGASATVLLVTASVSASWNETATVNTSRTLPTVTLTLTGNGSSRSVAWTTASVSLSASLRPPRREALGAAPSLRAAAAMVVAAVQATLLGAAAVVPTVPMALQVSQLSSRVIRLQQVRCEQRGGAAGVRVDVDVDAGLSVVDSPTTLELRITSLPRAAGAVVGNTLLLVAVPAAVAAAWWLLRAGINCRRSTHASGSGPYSGSLTPESGGGGTSFTARAAFLRAFVVAYFFLQVPTLTASVMLFAAAVQESGSGSGLDASVAAVGATVFTTFLVGVIVVLAAMQPFSWKRVSAEPQHADSGYAVRVRSLISALTRQRCAWQRLAKASRRGCWVLVLEVFDELLSGVAGPHSWVVVTDCMSGVVYGVLVGVLCIPSIDCGSAEAVIWAEVTVALLVAVCELWLRPRTTLLDCAMTLVATWATFVSLLLTASSRYSAPAGVVAEVVLEALSALSLVLCAGPPLAAFTKANVLASDRSMRRGFDAFFFASDSCPADCASADPLAVCLAGGNVSRHRCNGADDRDTEVSVCADDLQFGSTQAVLEELIGAICTRQRLLQGHHDDDDDTQQLRRRDAFRHRNVKRVTLFLLL